VIPLRRKCQNWLVPTRRSQQMRNGKPEVKNLRFSKSGRAGIPNYREFKKEGSFVWEK